MDLKDISRKNRVEIDKNFKTFFSELEKRHVEIRIKVNFFSTNGRELEGRLSEEIEIYEPWRLDIMSQLSAITSNFDDEQKKAYQKFIQDTKYYEIVQDAPFYWRIINKPNGYAGDAEMMNFIYRIMKGKSCCSIFGALGAHLVEKRFLMLIFRYPLK